MEIYRIIYVGSSGTGKTYRMIEDLKSLQGRNKIYLVSPTAEQQEIYAENSNLFEGYWDKLTEDILGEIETLVGKASSRGPHIIIVFDDVGSSLRKVNQERLDALINNARHTPVTLIFLIQKVTQASPSLRLNGDMYVIFNTQNKSELRWITDEFGGNMRSQDMTQLLRQAWKEPYGYIRIIKTPTKAVFLDSQGNLLY
jgi:hypothetical protein